MANITSFSSKNNSSLTADNSTYLVENANQSYSLTEPDSDTLRFQLQSGDHWSSPDYTDPSTSQRDEVAGTTVYQPGTQINLSYDFMVEPGATDTSNGPGKWTVLGQMHEYNVSDSPPFAVELVNGDHMAINIGTGNPNYLYVDPNPIVRGQYYSMQVEMKFDDNGNGFLEVWRNGVQIVDYHGPLGTGAPVYWKEGIYRSSSSQTMAVDYKDLQITTGAAAPPTSGSASGSTSTGSTSSGGTTTASGGTSSGGTSSSGATSGSTTGSTSTGSTSSGGSTTASGGTSSGGTSSSGTTSGSTTGSTSTGSTSSGGSTTASGGTSSGSTSSGSTSSGGTSVTDPTGSTSSGSTSGTGSSTTPKKPSLTVADHSLSVSPGKSVSLGLGVTVPNSKDSVKVTISGLPSYETITDNLDHKTFSGSSIKLTAAEVNSGLTLTSHYRGSGDPTATLTITAKDSAGASIAPQTITVKDPPVTASSGSSTGSSGSGTGSGSSHHNWWHDHHHAAASTSSVTSTTTSAATNSGTPTTTSSTPSNQSSAGHTSITQWFNDHPGFTNSATTLSEAGASKSNAVSNATTTTSSTPSVSATAYALLNQMMAHDLGGNSHFAQAATALSASSQQQANLLTRPVH